MCEHRLQIKSIELSSLWLYCLPFFFRAKSEKKICHFDTFPAIIFISTSILGHNDSTLNCYSAHARVRYSGMVFSAITQFGAEEMADEQLR